MNSKVSITDVTMRDGLQALGEVVPTRRKLELIDALIDLGVTRLEVASFVNPKLVPTMADADLLCSALPRDRAQFGGVVLDARGMDRLLAVRLDWAEAVVAASSTFLERNQRTDRAGAMARVAEISAMRHGTATRLSAYISCCFACPYEGPTDPTDVLSMAEQLLAIGVDDIYLADTTGRGTPPAVRRLLDRLLPHISPERIGCHFHDTYGQAIANLDAALSYGLRRIDAAAAGLGGCIFAKGATGNVASEDVLTLVAGHGLESGIDGARLARFGAALCDELGEPNHSKTGMALARTAASEGQEGEEP